MYIMSGIEKNTLRQESSVERVPPDNRAIDLIASVEEKEAVISGVNLAAEDFNIYDTDYKSDLHPDNNLTFHIGTDSFELPEELSKNLERYGKLIVDYYKACDELFRSLPDDHKWKQILSSGKPEWLLESAVQEEGEASHIFLRPDFILTEEGVVTTEIETSPFGLALSYFLNKSYSEQGCDVAVDPDILMKTFINEALEGAPVGKSLCFVLTDHTKKYIGQFEYLGRELSKFGVNVEVANPEELVVEESGEVTLNGQKIDCIYRGFYLHETQESPDLKALVMSNAKVVPGAKSHLEEKSMMGMIWDKDLEPYFEEQLGEEALEDLRAIIPQTYILDGDPPEALGIDSWKDISKISRKKRSFILKVSGFSDQGSWAKGVTFLNRLSQVSCERTILEALSSDENFVIQEFKKGKKFEQEYYDFESGSFITMTGKVRFTPYFCAKTGKLLTAKSTMCPNTDFIHATSNSINTPVKCKNQ